MGFSVLMAVCGPTSRRTGCRMPSPGCCAAPHATRRRPGGTSAMTAATTVTEAAMECPEGNDAPVVATSDPGGLVRS